MLHLLRRPRLFPTLSQLHGLWHRDNAQVLDWSCCWWSWKGIVRVGGPYSCGVLRQLWVRFHGQARRCGVGGKHGSSSAARGLPCRVVAARGLRLGIHVQLSCYRVLLRRWDVATWGLLLRR